MPSVSPRKLTRTPPKNRSPATKVTLSTKGKVLGRPRLARGPMAQVQTRVPASLSDYLKMLSLARLPDQEQPFRTMQKMFEALFTRFLADEPWTRGFDWRDSHAVARFSGGEVFARSHWKQLNIQLPAELAKRVEIAAHRQDRSQSSFCYTALCWWAGSAKEALPAIPTLRIGAPGQRRSAEAASGKVHNAKLGWLQFVALCDLKKPNATPLMVELSLSSEEIKHCLRKLGETVPREEFEQLPRLLDALKGLESKYAEAPSAKAAKR